MRSMLRHQRSLGNRDPNQHGDQPARHADQGRPRARWHRDHSGRQDRLRRQLLLRHCHPDLDGHQHHRAVNQGRPWAGTHRDHPLAPGTLTSRLDGHPSTGMASARPLAIRLSRCLEGGFRPHRDQPRRSSQAMFICPRLTPLDRGGLLNRARNGHDAHLALVRRYPVARPVRRLLASAGDLPAPPGLPARLARRCPASRLQRRVRPRVHRGQDRRDPRDA